MAKYLKDKFNYLVTLIVCWSNLDNLDQQKFKKDPMSRTKKALWLAVTSPMNIRKQNFSHTKIKHYH